MRQSMRERARNRARVGLMTAGARLGARYQRQVRTLQRYWTVGAWSTEVCGGLPRHTDERYDLFSHALAHVRGAAPLYLEFGVYSGETLRWWTERLTSPRARFVGFDSFEGLPEDWTPSTRRGAFATETVPTFTDERVSLEVGWFDDTLPRFELPPHDQLLVNIDSDLYSSARTVLSALEPHLVPGTLVYFDEFSDLDHEWRAWQEYLQRTGTQVRALGVARGGIHWLFEVVRTSAATHQP